MKMVHKNLIVGLILINMWEIGKIIRKMVSEFNTTLMEINMRVDGAKTSDMARELTGWLMPRIN